jgi:hypothetical protein
MQQLHGGDTGKDACRAVLIARGLQTVVSEEVAAG